MPNFIVEKPTIINPNNNLTIQQIDALNKLAGIDSTYTSPALAPNGNGLYRQSPNIVTPNTISSFELQKLQADRINERIRPVSAPLQNTPTVSNPNTINTPVAKPNVVSSLTNYSNSPIANAYNRVSTSPNVQRVTQGLSTGSEKLSGGLNRVSSGLVAVQSAVAVGTSIANYAKKPDIASAVDLGLTTLSTGLMFVPNPIAQGLGLLLAIGKPLITSFFNSPQNAPVEGIAAPFTGGQGALVQYSLSCRVRQFENGGLIHTAIIAHDTLATVYGAVRSITAAVKANGDPVNGLKVSDNDPNGNPRTFAAGTGFANYASPLSVIVDQIELRRKDGQPDTSGNPAPLTPNITTPNNNGFESPDLSGIENRLDDFQSRLGDIQSGIDSIQNPNINLDDLLQGLKGLQANNGITPYAQPRVPQPLPQPRDKSKITSGITSNLTTNLTVNNPLTNNPVSKVPTVTPNQQLNLSKQTTPTGKVNPSPVNTPSPTQQADRFKQPSDCNFSCSELAKCFKDIKVDIFDGCDPVNGTAKKKEITIQVLPKDEAKTKAIFADMLDVRSKECSLNDRVVVVPEYWQVRVGQRPQAGILYREFKDGKFTDSYYTLYIPHFIGTKSSKPKLTQYSKGEVSAIYVCKDNSRMTVFADTEQEAKRVINQLEKYVDPKVRGDIVKIGKRSGLKKTVVKPIRLDYFSTGQIKLNPDWSISL